MKKKIILLGWLSIPLVIGSIFAAVWYFIVFPQKKHQARIHRATELMQSFEKEQWEKLYEECIGLLDNQNETVIHPELRPPMISELDPYIVGIRENEIWMNWTGGFDDFSLYLHATVGDSENGTRAKGIVIFDTRDLLPKQPYTANIQPDATGQRR